MIGYVRISRDRANETSTETQRAAIEAWCTAHGHQLITVVSEPGRSAFKASRKSRPGFREVMNLVAGGAGDMLAVWKVDRACRNTLDLLTLVQDLEGHDAEFASVTEQFDTSIPMGKAMMTIVGVLAELESAQKSERATEWHHHRRINATVPAGPPALGYVKPRPNELAPDPKVAPLVREAAVNIINGASVLSAVKALNAAGVEITHRGLTTALQSPTLAGLVAVSDGVLPRRGGARVLDDAELVAGGWEPVLDLGTWQQVSSMLADPNRSTTRGNRLKYALAPVARCHCGSRMHVHIERWKKNGGTGEMLRLLCDDTACATGIGYTAVERAIETTLLELLDRKAWNRLRTAVRSDPAAAVADVESRLRRMWQLVLDGSIDMDEYAEAKARWTAETATEPAMELPDVDDLRAAWADFQPAEKLLVYRAALNSLVIKPATRRGGRGVDLDRVDPDWRI